MEVVWSKSSIKELRKIYEHIAKDSVLNAQRVISTLVDLTIELAVNPSKYPLDKFKTQNNGTPGELWKSINTGYLTES